MDITVQGHSVRCYTGGQPVRAGLPTLLFLHGAANDHAVWHQQTRWFAHHGFNVIAPDLPGHGNSRGEPLAAIEEIAGWTAALLDALGIGKVGLIGHSMGSLAALATAARFPERVEKLVLVGCAVPMNVSDTLLSAARDDPPGAIAMVTGWSHAPASLLSGGPLPGMWLPGMNKALMWRAAPGVLRRDLLNCRDYRSGLDAARQVCCPALLVVGERDLMTPRKAATDLRASLANAREALIAGAGHAMMNEAPGEVRNAIFSFLDGK